MTGGALAGVRVIELAGQGPVPFAAGLLADHGATVTRVAGPARGRLAGLGNAAEPMSGGRHEVVLDLTQPSGREALLELVATADALVEGYRPGVTERLGVGPDECSARNPRLVYVRVSGWGQDGPLRDRAGHDINYLARSGALAAIGPAERPAIPLNLVADYAAGAMFAAVGLLAALHERQHSGRGQVVDAALAPAVSYLMGPTFELWQHGAWTLKRGDNVLDGGAPFYDVYATRDGRHVALGALEAPFFAELRDLVGASDHPAFQRQWDRSTWPAMRAELAERLAQRTCDEWTDLAADRDACVDPVLTVADVARRGVGMVPSGGDHVVPEVAPKLSRTPGRRVSARGHERTDGG